MKIAMFYHSLISCWNHGNAHFLRGFASELIDRGHNVQVYEPSDSWSVMNLIKECGPGPIRQFQQMYPQLRSIRYELDSLDLDAALDGVQLVIVHEWNTPQLAQRLCAHHQRRGGYALLFHDTHHRVVSDPAGIDRFDLNHFDGVLAFGQAVRQRYHDRGVRVPVWVWHEAADTRVFGPRQQEQRQRWDVVWIGNWGDDERTQELREFLIDPISRLKLRAIVFGVRYPEHALQQLAAAGIEYGGYLPNFRAPEVFAQARATVHVPRRPYREALPGIPTIRPFEAMACGIPLLSAPWDDVEQLFEPGRDFLFARDGRQMQELLRQVIDSPALAASLSEHGRETIEDRHTCRHRVDQLLEVGRQLGACNS